MREVPVVNTRTLHVVTHRRWVADDLAAAAALTHAGTAPETRVRHHLGLDVPEIADGDALWAPMEWAARARHAGALLHLSDPGPRFLTTVPAQLLGREVHACAVWDLVAGDGPEEGFFKPANVKIDRVSARWWAREEFLTAVHDAAMPPSSRVLWTTTRLDIVEEHRIFVLDHQPATSSIYLRHDTHTPHDARVTHTWHEQMLDPRRAQAQEFASTVLAELAGSVPASFVLDVALLADDSWVVLEANPTWCSAQYGADLGAVIDSLFAACSTPAGSPWAWTPDPYLAQQARLQRLLPLEARRP